MDDPPVVPVLKSACLVWLDTFSDTLSDQSWLLPFRGTSLLKCCVSHLFNISPWPLLMVAAEATGPETKAALSSSGAPMYWARTRGNVFALARAAADCGLDRALIVHGLLGLAGLLPETLLRDLVGRHVEAGVFVTELEDLPEPLSVHVCERQVIDLLAALPLVPGVADDPKTVLDRLDRAYRSAGPGLGLRRVSIFTDHGLLPTEVPKVISWTTCEDLSRIEAVVLDPQLTNPRERLRRLREIMVDQLERESRNAACFRPRVRASPRVLYASAPSGFSGAEQCLVNSITSLRQYIKEINALVGREGVFANRLRSCGATVHCPQWEFSRPSVRSSLLIDQVIDAVRPDVIHCNGVVGIPLLAAARRRAIPLVQWVRFADLRGFDEHLVCADRITAVSQFIAAEVSKQMVRTDKIRVVYDGVDCERYTPVSSPSRNVRSELGISSKEFLILCIARFVQYKRHDVLLEAIARVSEQYSNLRLVLIGEPDSCDSTFEACAHALEATGLAARTVVLGFQPDVLPYELAADVIVLCSEREPLGTVVLESMSLEKPVIVAASGGLPEMVEDGFSGLHCIPGDPGSLSKQICRLIEDPALGEALGKRARQEVAVRFSLQAHAESLVGVYQEFGGRPFVSQGSAKP